MMEFIEGILGLVFSLFPILIFGFIFVSVIKASEKAKKQQLEQRREVEEQLRERLRNGQPVYGEGEGSEDQRRVTITINGKTIVSTTDSSGRTTTTVDGMYENPPVMPGYGEVVYSDELNEKMRKAAYEDDLDEGASVFDDCDAHRPVVSTEGTVSTQGRAIDSKVDETIPIKERLAKYKAEKASKEGVKPRVEAHSTAPQSRVGQSVETKVHAPGKHSAFKPAPVDTDAPKVELKFDKNSLLQGLIYSEILGKPKSMRRG